MSRNNDRIKSRIVPLVAISLSAVVVLTGIITIATSGTKAKYKTQQVVSRTPVTVVIDADLADSFEIKEHKAVRSALGDYALTTEFAEDNENTYHLMPGVDIPKDPTVYVTGKTEIEAYLYIEVVDSTGIDHAFSYTVDSTKWHALSVSGRNGGTVYAYQSKLTKNDTEYPNYEIPVLSTPSVTVGWDLDMSNIATNAQLKFFAYMAQAADGKSEVEIYNSQLATP